MYRTFNMGIGLVLFVSEKNVNEIMIALKKLNEKAFIIGKVLKDSSVILK